MFLSRGTVTHVKTRSDVSHELKKKSLPRGYRRETNAWYTFVSDILISLVIPSSRNRESLRILANLIFDKVIVFYEK